MAWRWIIYLTVRVPNCISQSKESHPGTEPQASALGSWSPVWQQSRRKEVKEEKSGGNRDKKKNVDSRWNKKSGNEGICVKWMALCCTNICIRCKERPLYNSSLTLTKDAVNWIGKTEIRKVTANKKRASRLSLRRPTVPVQVGVTGCHWGKPTCRG